MITSYVRPIKVVRQLECSKLLSSVHVLYLNQILKCKHTRDTTSERVEKNTRNELMRASMTSARIAF